MGFTKKVQYYLVHTLKFSNKEAGRLINEGKLKINGKKILENCILKPNDEVMLNGKIIQQKKPLVYIKYYKPVGLVSSLNQNVPFSLFSVFEHKLPLFIAGRLDKYSEGLLILSNDGKWLKNVTDPGSGKEKEYLVKLDKPFDENFISNMSAGVNIKFYTTKPCFCERLSDDEFRIILKEGKNKQIRRMCQFFGLQVTKLKRIRIDIDELGDMKPGDHQLLKKQYMLQH